jgi:transcriptional regulator with XRE-family HTH domain
MTTRSDRRYTSKDLERRMGRRTIGAFLRSWRLGQELSQVEFGKQLGLSRANLCDIEAGRKRVSAQRAAEFARQLGYSVNVLVEMALEEELACGGLDFKVTVKPRAA